MTDVRTAPRSSPARARLASVADELFYADGITATGIDRLIAEAQVTKATFYKQYGSKDALILEYIEGRDQQVRTALGGLLDALRAPAAVLSAVIDAVVADTARPDFRGDPFLNAAAEFPAPVHPVRLAVAQHRDWFTGFLEDRFRELGHPRPGAAADEFSLLRDGAVCGSYAGDAIAATSAFDRAARRLLAGD
ncbi:TetR family transcriptional regulator [Amnibacterium kyonggiense]|uniref:TetR family transcriptional regulator n=1 Tax=Amnibacterium kyonggiense TaxID=595671 RepID=A0A4R7FGA7_9MICO|nr:TetR family transcriptional regulator [Amnibacterium kyonggiense]